MAPLTLLFAFFFTACGAPSPEDSADDRRPDPVQAHVIDSIGVYEGEAPYMFGRIGGITTDDEGRIFVADLQAHEVRVFGADGTFQFVIGEEGEGPGELQSPCCPAFDADGHLWVRDIGNMRYNQYDASNEFASLETISMAHRTHGLMAPITFGSEGHLIDVGSGTFDPDTENFPVIRYHRNLGEETLQEVEVPSTPHAEQAGMHILACIY